MSRFQIKGCESTANIILGNFKILKINGSNGVSELTLSNGTLGGFFSVFSVSGTTTLLTNGFVAGGGGAKIGANVSGHFTISSDGSTDTMTFIPGTGQRIITGPSSDGTLALVADITGGTRAGSFTTLATSGATTIGGNVTPSATSTYHLGTFTSNKWSSVAAAIYMYSPTYYLNTAGTIALGVSGTVAEINNGSVGTYRGLKVSDLTASGTLAVTGKSSITGLATGLATKTTDYTATATDHKILADTRAGPISITLPTSVSISGTEYLIKDWKGSAATNPITVITTSGQLIDGQSSYVISNNYQSVTFVSDGAGWAVI